MLTLFPRSFISFSCGLDHKAICWCSEILVEVKELISINYNPPNTLLASEKANHLHVRHMNALKTTTAETFSERDGYEKAKLRATLKSDAKSLALATASNKNLERAVGIWIMVGTGYLAFDDITKLFLCSSISKLFGLIFTCRQNFDETISFLAVVGVVHILQLALVYVMMPLVQMTCSPLWNSSNSTRVIFLQYLWFSAVALPALVVSFAKFNQVSITVNMVVSITYFYYWATVFFVLLNVSKINRNLAVLNMISVVLACGKIFLAYDNLFSNDQTYFAELFEYTMKYNSCLLLLWVVRKNKKDFITPTFGDNMLAVLGRRDPKHVSWVAYSSYLLCVICNGESYNLILFLNCFNLGIFYFEVKGFIARGERMEKQRRGGKET